MIATQERESVAVKDACAAAAVRAPIRDDRFAFWHGDRRVGSQQPDRRTKTDSTLDMTPDSEHMIDRRLSLAVSCLDVLRQRDEDSGGG